MCLNIVFKNIVSVMINSLIMCINQTTFSSFLRSNKLHPKYSCTLNSSFNETGCRTLEYSNHEFEHKWTFLM